MGIKTTSSSRKFIFKSVSGLLSSQITTISEHRWINTFARTGSNSPKYKQIIANRGNATTPMSVQIFKLDLKSTASGSVTALDSFGRPYGISANLPKSMITSPSFQAPVSTVASNSASAAILKKIRKEQSSLMGGVILKEIGQTAHLIRHPFEAIQHYIRGHIAKVETGLKDVRRLPRKKRAPATKQMLANTWLETQFAIGPLLSDVRDGAVAYAKVFERPRLTRLSTFAQHEVQSTNSYTNEAAAGLLYAGLTLVTSNKYTCSYHVGVCAQTDYDARPLARVQELAGFTLSDFVPTIWEILPWSFLIDYFSNVGDVLTAATTDTSSVLWSSRCDTAETIVRSDQSFDIARTVKTMSGQGYTRIVAEGAGSGSYVSSAKTITRSSGIEYPTLTFELPTSPLKLANMLALFVSGQRLETKLQSVTS